MRKVLVAIAIWSLAMFALPTASAHVEIISAFPEQYTNVNPIPTEAWIQFSGNLQSLDGEILNTIEVTDSTNLVVSYGDAIVEAGKISTRISGQSAAGVFTVRYRVVGQDGHIIEGEYTFNASPDYAAQQSPTPAAALPEESSIPVGGLLLAFLLASLFGGIYMKSRNRRND
jgi:methionine-rich copper-binding protein CopC